MRTARPLNQNSFTSWGGLFRLGGFIALAALVIIPLFSISSASLSQRVSSSTAPGGEKLAKDSPQLFGSYRTGASSHFSALAETIDTFAADCTTPKTSFLPGETVCAVTNGVDLMGDRHVNWIDPNLTVVGGGDGVADISTNPQNFSFTIPNSGSSIGNWKASIATPSDSSETPAIFTVTAPPPFATYAAGCVILQSSFTLGDVVCLKVVGAPLGIPGVPARKVAWVSRRGSAVQFDDVTNDPQQITFTLPTANTTTLVDDGGGQVVVENRGVWKALLLSTGDGSVADSVSFNVNAPTASVDLAVSQSAGVQASEVESGNSSVFDIFVTNNGPSDAASVVLTENVPTNTTFGTLVESTSFGAVCGTPISGVATCTIGTLPKGATAKFNFSYSINSGVAPGTLITNLVSVTSTTAEIDASDNSSSAEAIVPIAGGAETCTLTCRDNFTVTANTTEAGNPGRFVTFTATNQIAGNCGAVSATPASGTFFPVGTTLINVASENGGGSCSFTVTVTNAPAPTISCPANQTVTAAVGADSAPVAVGTPTTVPASGVTVTGLRSDDDDDPDTPVKPLSDPYPIGVTFIDWKVTDATGQSASCQQRITVNAPDRETLTISCPANQSVVAPSGTCDAPAIDPGTPTTNPSDANVTVTGVRNDGQALADPFPSGVTTITWTAIDGINGNVASCQQTITVTGTDTVDPTISVPANVSTTTSSCTATLDDELGVATADDNCSQSVNIARTGVPANFVFPTGTTTITYIATDASGNTATGTQLVTVTESPAVPPTVTAPADVTLFTGPGATSCGVTVADLNAGLGVASANDNCPGVSVSRSGVPAGNIFPLGNTTVTYIATDKSGNTASDTQVVTVVDNTAPVISCPSNITVYLPLNSTATSMPVSWSAPTATDNCSTPTVGTDIASGSVFSVGTTTVTATATDAANNSSTCQFTVTVLYNFTGFFSPIENPPTVNSMKAGQAAPVKFSLSGNKGLNIFAAGSPSSVQVNCVSGDPESPVEETETAGQSTLTYDAANDQYKYVWKTENSWKNTCRILSVTLNDGSVHTAKFTFK